MGRKKILLVEDEEDILQLLGYTMSKAGFQAILASSGEEALEKLGAEPTDLVILDLMLPGISGLDVCKAMRQAATLKDIPVLMLTAKSEENDIVTGLALGADDYVTKPFSPKVLLARVMAILRRKGGNGIDSKEDSSTPIRLGDLFIDPARFELKVAGQPVLLTLTEFNIIKLLARRPGWVFARLQIIDEVRGYEYNISPRAVDVHISSLRRKLGSAGAMIESVRGLGYRLRG